MDTLHFAEGDLGDIRLHLGRREEKKGAAPWGKRMCAFCINFRLLRGAKYAISAQKFTFKRATSVWVSSMPFQYGHHAVAQWQEKKQLLSGQVHLFTLQYLTQCTNNAASLSIGKLLLTAIAKVLTEINSEKTVR